MKGVNRLPAYVSFRGSFLSFAAIILAYFAWMDSVRAVFENDPLANAPGFIRDDPLLLVEHHDDLVWSAEKELPQTEDMQTTARQALLARPLNSAAVRQLGGRVRFSLDQSFDVRSLKLSERVSRRDRLTQLALSLEAAKEGDEAQSFEHVDRLLTVRPSLVTQVLPLLLSSLKSEQAAELFRAKTKRPWFSVFLRQGMTNSTDPEAIVNLLATLDFNDLEIEAETFNRFASRLANAGLYEQSRRMAKKNGLEQDALRIFKPSSENVGAELSPLTWALADQVEGTVSLAESGLVEVVVRSGGRFVAMDRVFASSSGARNLNLALTEQDGPMSLIQWSLRCPSDNKWPVVWRSGWQGIQGRELDFQIPLRSQTCEYPRWQMEVQAGEGKRETKFLFKLSLN